ISMLNTSSILSFSSLVSFFNIFFFCATTTADVYSLSLHDALPILACVLSGLVFMLSGPIFLQIFRGHLPNLYTIAWTPLDRVERSEEHTSELQSPYDIVCRLLLEKKKKQN